MKPKNARRLDRRAIAVLDQRRRYLIVAEGSVTEREYFEHLGRKLRAAVNLVVDPKNGVPKTLVEVALTRKKHAEKLAKRDKDDTHRYDEVWCVFDVDEHPNIAEARQLASSNDIRVAISNPCFELWVLLHFQDHTATMDRKKLRKRLKTHIPDYDKHLSCEELYDKCDDAIRRSKYLEKECRELGEPRRNPSTQVHKLVESIRGNR